MKQLEIEFFFPLTEQVCLDLDFTPCEEYSKKRQQELFNSVSITAGQALWAFNGGSVTAAPQSLTNMTEFRPTKESVGYWLVSPELKYYVSKEPNWFVKKMTKFMLGWEWGKKN